MAAETPADSNDPSYLHGFTSAEQDRLYRQARFLEHKVHDRLPFGEVDELLEIGCGVGAQTAILLRLFWRGTGREMKITGIDRSASNLAAARTNLERLPWDVTDRVELVESPAESLSFDSNRFDGAFLCWVLEHVVDPPRVLAEARRVLRPGSPIVISEVMNATFFIDPYSPRTLDFWRAMNDRQLELGGDPFIGAKLGNLLLAGGYRDIETRVETFHLDNRRPGERARFLAYWSELLLSAAPGLIDAGVIDAGVVDGMKQELTLAGRDPNAVFFYSFVQARARV